MISVKTATARHMTAIAAALLVFKTPTINSISMMTAHHSRVDFR